MTRVSKINSLSLILNSETLRINLFQLNVIPTYNVKSNSGKFNILNCFLKHTHTSSRPPQVDLVPARYIFFSNVPFKMRENSENLDI